MSNRSHHAEAGFSLMELLVTIVLAAIIFAAMIPFFVQAAKASSSDKARAVALNIAQGRIDAIRQIDFELVVDANLNIAGTSNQFATTVNEHAASGDKPYTVTTHEVDIPASATDPRVVSKKVTVTVSWSTPKPGSSVSLATVLYRQYVGPQIIDFTVSPFDVEKDWITSADVLLTATVSADDLDSMKTVTVGSGASARTLTGYVEFQITSVDGHTVVPPIKVPYDSSHPATFSTNWTVPGGTGVGDGYYTFKAVGYTALKYPGNTWEFSKHVESGPPGPVQNLQGSGGNQTVNLTWQPSLSADKDHYEVYRTDQSGTRTLIAGDPATTPKWLALGWTDPGLQNGQYYTYQVYVIDQAGNRSVPATVIVLVQDPSTAPPAPATGLKGDKAGNFAHLVWTASATPDVLGYQVYMDNNTTTPVATVGTPYADFAQAWATTHSYQVKAYRPGNVLSILWATIFTGYPVTTYGSTNWVKVQTDPATTYNLSVINDVSASNKKASISLWYKGPTGTDLSVQVLPPNTNIQYGNAATWTGLAYGKYEWKWTTTDNPAKTGSKEELFTWVAGGGVLTVSRHCLATP
jgi:prepilin-type N-terminal cleavage/methylation domain-containing protein